MIFFLFNNHSVLNFKTVTLICNDLHHSQMKSSFRYLRLSKLDNRVSSKYGFDKSNRDFERVNFN